jgi:protein involved in polysaccharide export with SLBB domain
MLRICGIREILLFILIPSVATVLYAQASYQGDNSGKAQSGSEQDCSDPLSQGTQDCAGQTQQESTPLTAPQTGTSSQLPNKSYSDIESLSRRSSQQNLKQRTLLLPEPLTEFQKFVASTSGQILPIYGANLFSSVPSTFAPLDLTPVPPDYVVGPGDELRIRVWGQVSIQTNVRVDRSGEIFIPQIGPVHVAGMSFSALSEHLRGAVGRVYRNFQLTVDVGQIRAIQVYVSGEARRPGVYTVSSLSTLVDALFASGGPSVQGSMRHVQLRRGSAVVADFDLYDLLLKGDKSKDVKLQSGDVIFIPPVGSQAAVTGSVRNSAIYELRTDEQLAELLSNAGGLDSVASKARISIERIDDHRERSAMEVAYDPSGLATPVADGDLVRVYAIAPLYRKTISLRGNTANPGRFAWHQGMRVSELIPEKDSLITRNYWWRRVQLGLPAPEFEPVAGFATRRQPVENHAITLKTFNPEARRGSKQYRSQQDQSGLDQSESGLDQSQSGLDQSQSGLDQSQSGLDQNQSGLDQNQDISQRQRSDNSPLAAQQLASSASIPDSAQRTQVKVLAPEIDWSYAVIERLDSETLKTTLLPFDLGRLVLQHDASQDLELQAGDVVSIFSEADIHVPIAQQTKLVTLAGEFVHAGVYSVQPGETFNHLVERAGGFTPDAYLYGSMFTRKSTRAVQQARIDEYVRNLSMTMQRGNLAASSSSASSAQDMASATASESSERSLLTSLQLVRATGRIVLKFTPESRGMSNLPDIALEDGDNFTVPSVPATVNVVGAVYDQNSFLYAQRQRAGAYLQLAGGPDRDADWHHEFIIRADGEVVSRVKSKTIWGGGDFNNLHMNPGDTIVVPEKTFRPSALRGIIDWSQMFSQFALGAAALSILK